MKRKISISFIAASLIFMLALAILPHYHHDGQVYIVMGVCEQNDKVNDDHAHHNDTPEEGHDGTCIIETEYITSLFKNETKYKIFSCKDYNHIYLFPIYFLVADLLNFDTGNFLFKTGYGEYTSLYKSAEATQFNGLRAPPFMLS